MLSVVYLSLKLVTLLSSSKPFDISFVLLWTIYKGSALMWLGVLVEVLVGDQRSCGKNRLKD